MGGPSPGTPGSVKSSEDRLDSWKEIAAHLNRDVTTVQRWEKREGMPVHRHLHDKMGSVYALRSELDVWALSRSGAAGAAETSVTSTSMFFTRRRWIFLSVMAAIVLLAAVAIIKR